MQKIFKTVIVLLFFSTAASGQIALQAIQFRPIGDLGFAMNPATSAELAYTNRFEQDERWRSSISATYLKLTPRLDTFPLTATLGSKVLPGTIIYSNYELLLGFVGMDYKILETNRWQFFTGLSIIAGVHSLGYKKFVATVEEGVGGYTDVVTGFRARAGVEYLLSDKISVLLTGDFYQLLPVIKEGATQLAKASQAYSIGLGVRYNFKD
jgi:hypothetical protein